MSRGRRPVVLVAAGVVVAALLAVVLFVGVGTGSHTAASSDVAPGVSTAAANLLQLDVFGSAARVRTPDFLLSDQYGKPVAISKFRGKTVVLSFNDDRCPDLCTLLAQDIVVANRDMGAAARHVVFLSVNVNPFYPAVSDVKAWTDSHGLGNQPNWYFATGPPKALAWVWQQFGVKVRKHPATKTVTHGSQLYFIDPAGHEAALGSFGIGSASTSLYAHAMAQMAVDLLPPDERTAVGGTSVPDPSQGGGTVGATVPSFALPALANASGTISSAGLRGSYTVLNFWSSTCTACTREMPAIERAAKELGPSVHVVGIDVSDPAAAGRAFATRAGATYPLASDADGSFFSSFREANLPFTVLVSPTGTVLARHPGALTTEQLVYIVRSEDQSLGGG